MQSVMIMFDVTLMNTILQWVQRLLQFAFTLLLAWSIATALLDLGQALLGGGGGFGGIWFYAVLVVGTPFFLILFFILRFLKKKYPNNVSKVFYRELPVFFIGVTLLCYIAISFADMFLYVPDRILWLRSDGEFFTFLSATVAIIMTSPIFVIGMYQIIVGGI